VHVLGSPLQFSFESLQAAPLPAAREGEIREIGSSGSEDLQFNSPFGMSIDPNDRIYVADRSNHRIQCLSPGGGFLYKFGRKGSKEGELNGPRDVFFDPGTSRVLVADRNNHRVQVFEPRGNFLLAFGAFGTGEGFFDLPGGVAADVQGNIYVSDYSNHRIQVFTAQGKFLWKITEPKTGGTWQLRYPNGVRLLSNGTILVAEQSGLKLFDPKGGLISQIGEGFLSSPQWLHVDEGDRVLVADNHRKRGFLFSKEGLRLQELGRDIFFNVWGAALNSRGDAFLSGQGRDGHFKIFVFKV